RMLVGFKSGHDDDTDTVHGGGARRIADRLAEEATRRAGMQYLWYPSGRHLIRHPWVTGASTIQVYNTHGGYISHRLLPALARIAPVVWRLSDMWAVTGHCAYSGPCERWREGCGACPDLVAYPPVPVDTTAWLWRIKRRIYARARPVIVAPSSWLERIAKESPLFAGLKVHCIPNGVDRSIFRAIPKAAAREVLGLPRDRKLLLYSAHVLTGNPRKGSADAEEACRHLAERTECDVVLLGFGGEGWRGRIPQRVHPLGFISDERLLAAAYAAADVAIAPSTVENLPNSILESMACGTPVVAYDTGGISDAVTDGKTGVLVTPGDAAALGDAAARLLADDDARDRIAQAGVDRIATRFDAAREARAFLDLHTSLAAARAE
ncbi:MAG: glycosyltransferase, partial [Alphaproteobacteria bacterium]|nr:glycosyltransferase [Alphaproteobacteria bacterium]